MGLFSPEVFAEINAASAARWARLRVGLSVEERDSRLYASNVVVHCADGTGRLDDETLECLDLLDTMPGRCARLKRCAECGQRFIGHWSRQTCGADCKRAAGKKALSKFREERRRRREAYRRDDERFMGECDVCEKVFDRARSSGRYCSAACRQRAYRRRKLAP